MTRAGPLTEPICAFRRVVRTEKFYRCNKRDHFHPTKDKAQACIERYAGAPTGQLFWNWDNENKAMDLYLSGMSCDEVGKQLRGVTGCRIREVLSRAESKRTFSLDLWRMPFRDRVAFARGIPESGIPSLAELAMTHDLSAIAEGAC